MHVNTVINCTKSDICMHYESTMCPISHETYVNYDVDSEIMQCCVYLALLLQVA